MARGTLPAWLSANERTRQRLAERDGGWACFYCGRPLADRLTEVGFIVRPAYACAGGHWDDDGRPCTPGATHGPDLLLAPGFAYPVIEHRIPSCRGGSSQLENLVLSCSSCNTAKGTLTDDEFLALR